MSALVSICIPTYRRPRECREAIDSAFQQTYSPLEILVSDDSPDDDTARMIAEHPRSSEIRYLQNSPPLRQANNVNQLFDHATGEYLLLLHDDDVLLEGAVKKLMNCITSQEGVIAAFGKQHMMSHEGVINEVESKGLNDNYHRTASREGRQSSEWSALMAQFPNDLYIVRADSARVTRYNPASEVGDTCDYDFGLRLSECHGDFYFLNEYVGAYRKSLISVSRNNNYTHKTFDLLANKSVRPENETARQMMLARYAVPAVNGWLRAGNRTAARRVYFSKEYPMAKRFSPRGLMQLILVHLPSRLTAKLLRK